MNETQHEHEPDPVEQMESIDRGASLLSCLRASLEATVLRMRERQREAVREDMEALRVEAAEYSAARDELEAMVGDAARLFRKPKSRSMHGVKVGFRKKVGKLVLEDERLTIDGLRELLPKSQTDLLIRVAESVDKTALKDIDLTPAQIKRLGISITRDTDEPFVTVAKGDLDKVVDALLAEDGDA